MGSVVHELSEDTKRVIRSLLLSKTTDGIIAIDELGDCLEAFGYEPDKEDIEFLKKHFDDNGDGNLEVDELVNNIDVLNYHCFYGKALMREFLRIDQDRDGIIRFPEMLRFLTTHEPNPLPALTARRLLDELARKFDANFDGKFSYAEFVKIYMSDKLPFRELLEKGEIPNHTSTNNSKDNKNTNNRTTSAKKIVKKTTQVSTDGRPKTGSSLNSVDGRPKTGSSLATPRSKPELSIDRPKTTKTRNPMTSQTSVSSNAFSYYDENEENEGKKTKQLSVWDRLAQPRSRGQTIQKY